MKHIYLLLLILSPLLSIGQEQEVPKEEGYDLKKYYFVMLTKGDKRDENMDQQKLQELQNAHLANIDRLAEEGRILVAGPFIDDKDWRGLFIFDAKSKEEVEELLKTDPMISAGWLATDIRPWVTAKNCVFK